MLRIFLYRLFLPKRYAEYLRRAGGNRDKCHEALLHGTYYEEYDLYDFAHKSEQQRCKYITDAYRNRVCRRINNSRQQQVIMDKYRTAVTFRDYYRRDFMLVDGEKDRLQFIEFGMRNGSLVVKPVDDCAGRGVRLLRCAAPEEWNAHFTQLMEQGRRCIAEQLIVQDPAMARWNSSSVNTVRINTIYRHGHIDCLTANIRCGRLGSFVDNCAQGGFCANIDEATGLITTAACGEGPERYDRHPDSGVPFVGERIPQWDALLQAAYAMARRLPKLTYVSWDLALTADGWTLVEANKGELIADQRNLATGLRPKFDRLIQKG